MDMDAWNWATEGDWWSNFFVAEDFPRVSLPAVCFTNQESYCESTKLYKPFGVADMLLESASKHHAGEEAPSSLRKCDATITPRFNPRNDVMQWSRIHRWSQNTQEKHSPLFLAAALSATHLSIEIDESMKRLLTILTLAVLDPSGPLQTLSVTQGSLRYRLAPVPRAIRCFQLGGDETVEKVLGDPGACFLPCFHGGWKASRMQSLVDEVKQIWAQDNPVGEPKFPRDVPPDIYPEIEFAIFHVLNQEERAMSTRDFTESLNLLGIHRMCSDHATMDTTAPRTPWLPSAASYAGPTEPPFLHGFCSLEYGLPA
jgi:hypothetical protein